jgi:CheY-like chemotaxis protein
MLPIATSIKKTEIEMRDRIFRPTGWLEGRNGSILRPSSGLWARVLRTSLLMSLARRGTLDRIMLVSQDRGRADMLIVVVDDDRDYLGFMEEVLTDEGHQVILCDNVLGVVDILLRGPPDLMILDLRMGYPTAGIDLLDQLRNDPATAQIPAIVCSADVPFLRKHASSIQDRRCEILEKPFSVDELVAKMDQAAPRAREVNR